MNYSLYEIPDRSIVRTLCPRSAALTVLAVLVLLTALPVVAQDDPVTEAAAEPVADATVEAAIEIGFGLDVDRSMRTLVSAAETFAPEVEQVYCLTRLQGLIAPTTVTHAWYRDGEAMARVELPVRSTDWRTWSSKRILPAWTGAWEVKVLDETGKVLATRGFVIE